MPRRAPGAKEYTMRMNVWALALSGLVGLACSGAEETPGTGLGADGLGNTGAMTTGTTTDMTTAGTTAAGTTTTLSHVESAAALSAVTSTGACRT